MGVGGHTKCWGSREIEQPQNVEGLQSNIPPDSLGGKRWAPIPAEGALCLEEKHAYTSTDAASHSLSEVFFVHIHLLMRLLVHSVKYF